VASRERQRPEDKPNLRSPTLPARHLANCPRQELNLFFDLWRVVCRSVTLQGRKKRRWESNPLRPGCSRLPGHQAPASFCRTGHFQSIPAKESNLVHDLRTVGRNRYTPRIAVTRADDWFRTSMVRITSPAPFCVEPRRLFRGHGGNRTHHHDFHRVVCETATTHTPFVRTAEGAGVEPAKRCVRTPRFQRGAVAYRLALPQSSVVPGGVEPPIFPISGGRPTAERRDHALDGPKVIPDGLEPSLPGCKPAVVAAGPRDHFGRPDPVGDIRRGGRVCLYRRQLTPENQ
jgi:hypothetical protein